MRENTVFRKVFTITEMLENVGMFNQLVVAIFFTSVYLKRFAKGKRRRVDSSNTEYAWLLKHRTKL